FERLNATPDGRLLGVELGRGRAEASRLGDGEEKPHIVPVAENIRDLGLAGRSRNHSNNRYNVLAAQTFTSGGPLWFILHYCRRIVVFCLFCRALAGLFQRPVGLSALYVVPYSLVNQ